MSGVIPAIAPTARVAVVTVTYNSRDCVGRLLDSLAADGYAGPRTIVAVDNLSTDGVANWIAENHPQVRLIRNARNLGFGAANNLAVRWVLDHEPADYVAFLNPDVVVAPGWMTPLLDALEAHPNRACVQPAIMLADRPERANSLGNRVHYLGFGYVNGFGSPLPLDATPFPCAYASGAAFVMRTRDFLEIDGFDEDYFLYQEDQDLGWRLRESGRDISVVPASIVRHEYRFDVNPKKFHYLELHRWRFLLTHFQKRTLFLILPMLIAMEAGMAYYALSTGWWSEKLHAWGAFTRRGSWTSIVAARRRIRESRRLSDSELKPFLDGALSFSGLESRLFQKFANPFIAAYWKVVRALI